MSIKDDLENRLRLGITYSFISDKYEVSLRTAMRDIAALQELHVPLIYERHGHLKIWRLMDVETDEEGNRRKKILFQSDDYYVTEYDAGIHGDFSLVNTKKGFPIALFFDLEKAIDYIRVIADERR